MREIKFRAWCSGKHGSLTFSENSMDYNVVLSKNGYWCDVESGWDIHGEYETVPIMQFTGMKDYNGKEIYEGDIVRDYDEGFLYKVMFCEHYAQFMFYDYLNDDYYDNQDIAEHEIIGNIHENPELWEAYNGKNSYTQ